ncbi:MAG: DUF1573 domain-containing protein [Candidatus Cryptobacteroides sp.]
MDSFRTLLVVLLVCFWASVNPLSAQIKIIPRERLDSVSAPMLSEDSSYLSFDKTSVKLTMNEDDSPAKVEFAFRNIGEKALTVLNITTTCSCVKAMVSPRTVAPGAEAVLEVFYDPKGHPGRFDRKIMVYTSSTRPSAILEILAEVSPGSDRSASFPVSFGNLMLRRNEVRFEKGVESVEYIPVLNAGDKPLRVSVEKGVLPGWLTFSSQPSVIEPGTEGELVIGYKPGGKNENKVFPLMLSNLGVAPSKAVITVEIE